MGALPWLRHFGQCKWAACLEELNRVVQLFNFNICSKSIVDLIKHELPGSTFVHANQYKIIKDIIEEAASRGMVNFIIFIFLRQNRTLKLKPNSCELIWSLLIQFKVLFFFLSIVFINSIDGSHFTGFKEIRRACCDKSSLPAGGNRVACKKDGKVRRDRRKYVDFDGSHPSNSSCEYSRSRQGFCFFE